MTSEKQKEINKLIELYFNQPKILYEHLFASYHQFVNEIIPYSLIQEQNYFYENIEKELIYLHGFKCSDIRIKPSTFENDNEIKFPSDARKNHLNYFATIVVDIQQFVEKIDAISGERTIKYISEIEKNTPVANIPIMVKSKYCSTHIKQDLKGECKYDPGGYFIVNGAEKVVMSIEKMVDNKILVFTKKDPSYDEGLVYIAQINSKKNDWSDNLQILTLKNKKDGVLSVSTSSQLVDIPIFILLRALGIESDKDIISYIVYDLSDTKMLNLLRPSVINSLDEHNNPIRSKEEAMKYLIGRLKKNKRITQTDEEIAKIQKKMLLEKIFKQDLLPHLGEDIPKKIVFLGLIVNRLLNVMLGRRDVDDRDTLHNKRIEPPGILLGQLFRQNWKKMLNDVGKHFKKKNQSDENPINVISQIKPSIIEQGIKTALSTGFWGMNKTKVGVAQSLQRLSWVQSISYLRRILSPSMEDATAKITSIRQVNSNQIHLLCCLTADTEIQMGNKMDINLIDKISNGECVNTINPENLMQNPSKIYNKFCKYPNKLYQITTISGRTIKATPDHPFLINYNGKPQWRFLEDLKLDDKIIIKHCEKYIENNNNTDDISDDILTKFKIKNKLNILARLYGHFNKINYNDYLYSSIGYTDICDILNDIHNLGFNDIYFTKSNSNTNYNFKIMNTNSDFIYLLNSLGFMENTIPRWIINGSKLVKREFLSSLQGYIAQSNNYKNFYNIINNNELKYDIEYINSISQLFTEFNIQNQIINNLLIIDENNDNIINYCDYIGYRYNMYKTRCSAFLVEYCKCIQLNNYSDSIDNFIKENKINNLISVKIKEIKEINPEPVYDFTTVSDNHSFVANSFISSNCIETPEGAKIGIVKSLSMMASITVQNLSQFDIITKILKNNSYIKHPYDIDPLTMLQCIKIFVNGNWIGVCEIKHSQSIYEELKLHRKNLNIDRTTTIIFDYDNKEIKIYYDGGRLYRPLLIVNDNKLNITSDVINDINNEMRLTDKSKSWKKILSKYPNLIEYEDIESLNYLLVADSESKLDEMIEASNRKIEYTETTKINRYGDYRWIKYTHCDFHQWVMLGSIVSNIPFLNHNYSNRNIIHFSQAKQSIGIYLSSYKDRMDISQVLYHPHIPLVTTQAMKYNGCLDLPYGENAIVAICSYTGYNQEDSIIFNQSAIDRGIFRADTLKKYNSEIMKNPSTSQDDIFTKPDRNKVASMKQGNYEKLNEKGYIPEETIINPEDIIIGKISPIQPTGNNNKVFKDNSIIFKSNVQGVIDRIHTGVYNAEGYEMYNMRVRMERKPIPGDKFTNFHGAKGTIGIIYPQNDMPFTESGIIPDLILNPHGYPSRMSVAQFVETIASKEAAVSGHFVDGTPFNNYDISQASDILKKLGYSQYGTETMYCGLTGRKMDAQIFIGPLFTIRLKHMVLDKVHGRARGPRQALTRQPLEGRSRDGGLKIGEMEKDAMVAHGIGQFLKERLMETSDISKIHVCDDCGMFASKVIEKDYYRCKGCHNTTRISAVVIPYACKLLFQELTSVNILPRIRTEKSIYADEL